MGTTEESAIDPVSDVLKLREEFRAHGLDFTVHADGAWGGYHASVVRVDFDMPPPEALLFAPPPAPRLSKYVTAQYNSLGEVDSITVDPHKSGYIPYPSGALCYRNSAMRDLVTWKAVMGALKEVLTEKFVNTGDDPVGHGGHKRGGGDRENPGPDDAAGDAPFDGG